MTDSDSKNGLSAQVLDVLVCPSDRGKLDYDAEKNTLTCVSCGKKYRVEKSVPNMLDSDVAEK